MKEMGVGVIVMDLIKPQKLKAGDTVATVSLSWGGAGDADILWRYNLGKERLQEEFGLNVVEMPNTLKGSDYLYNHPEKRAEDLMQAFEDTTIKAVFSCIGGNESVRLLPFIDFDVIRKNPKILIGYSDTTIAHMMCLKSGVSSFYGASLLGEIAENVEIFEYTKYWIKKVLFNNEVIGKIEPSPVWTSEFLPWDEKKKTTRKTMQANTGYEILQGRGVVKGKLIGGCIEVLEMIKGTNVWPAIDIWNNTILFFETSEEKPTPTNLEYWLRNYGSQGILQRANGIIFGKPYGNLYYEEYKQVIQKVIGDELKLHNLPILYNASFGHTSPMMVLPYGIMAEINCEKAEFSIVEAAVL